MRRFRHKTKSIMGRLIVQTHIDGHRRMEIIATVCACNPEYRPIDVVNALYALETIEINDVDGTIERVIKHLRRAGGGAQQQTST